MKRRRVLSRSLSSDWFLESLDAIHLLQPESLGQTVNLATSVTVKTIGDTKGTDFSKGRSPEESMK